MEVNNLETNRRAQIGNITIPLLKGEQGDQGYSISRIARTDGDGTPGTIDTYTIYINTIPETAIGTFQVVNGTGGDMSKNVYDIDNDDIVDRATGDGNGNEITATYETIANVTALANRVATLEQAGYITRSVADLANYYLKSETYTKQEVNNLCDMIPKFAIEVVSALPTQDISETTIYLLRDDEEAQDVYQEYIYVNNTWERIGGQRIDLSNYYQKSEVDNLLNNKVDTSDLDSYYTKNSVDGLLNQKINTNDIIDNLTSTNTQVPLSANQGKVLKDLIDSNNNEKILYIRKKYYNKYHVFQLPVNLDSFFNKLTIYESIEKENYKYKIDEESLKNSGGSTIYVDKNYTGSSTGTSEAPYKTLQRGLEHAFDGDTIIVRAGIYRREQLPSSANIINNINIICEDGVLFTTSSELTWAQNTTYSNVYQATRSKSISVIDVRNRLLPIALEKKASLLECSNNIGSYYTDNTIVYVNLGEEVTNDKIVVSLPLGYSALDISPKANKDIKLYLENAICLNGDHPIVEARSTSSYNCEFNAKKCRFLYLNKSNSKDGVNLLGTNTVFIDCEASFNGKDGFNYHANNGKVCHAIEINCFATCNGLGRDDHTFNGSTIHDGSQIIRINGNYLKNNGGNVADVHENSISININCNAFDSMADTENAFSSDFCAQQEGATMYLYNCFAKGNSYKNIFAVPNTTIYISNCIYDSSYGNVIEI